MTADQTRSILDSLQRGELPAPSRLSEVEEPGPVIEVAMESPHGRRWLRSLTDLPVDLAESLLVHHEDFASKRRDRTLANVIERTSIDALARHGSSIAQGSGAQAFWSKLSHDPDTLVSLASAIVGGENPQAAESSLYLLLLDPIDQYGIGESGRVSIAASGLQSGTASVRSLAAEYLFDNAPEELVTGFQALIRDSDERVRGLGWAAGIRSDTATVLDLAARILEDKTEPVGVRRSALQAIGTSFETRDVVDLLATYVAHHDASLALDAANLLYRLHRHPTIAMAAAASEHQQVREIGEFLLDPYRGSPAAGGSRPGDPTRSDVFAQLIRETEERALEVDEPTERK